MRHMDFDTALMSRHVDPVELGRRIRGARLAAGLTQRDLAGDTMSTAYVSRIEVGQRRPSTSNLKIIAERTGTTVSALVSEAASTPQPDLALALDHAELALLSGDATTALEQATEVKTAATHHSAGSLLEVDAQYVRASALEALGELNEAIRLLEQVTSQPEPTVRWVKALVALCRCLKEQGAYRRAIEVGDQAAPLIEELRLTGLTESIQLSVSVAGAHTKLGNLDEAIRICARAVEAAEVVGSPVAKASAYWNASLVEGRRGAHHSALTLAQRALNAFEQSEDVRNIGRLRTQVAAMQLRTTPPDLAAALGWLEQAEKELAWSSASPLDKADHFLVTARARYLGGEIALALDALDHAEDTMGEKSPMLRSEACTLRGRIAFNAGDTESARRHYADAVHALSSVGSDRDAAQLWFEVGALLDQAGERDSALAAYRSAAVSTGLVPPGGDVGATAVGATLHL